MAMALRSPPKNPVVLIVDDSEDSLEVLSVLLSQLDCHIEKAGSGEEALEITQRITPALVMLDVSMPGMDGFEVCQRLRSDPRTRDATILFVSALGDLENRVRGLQGGGVDYIAKPFEPEEVVARVSTQLELYRLRQELVARNRELEALVREKDHFLDLAAHGLRHPLLQIRGLVGLLRSGQVEEQGRDTLVKTIAQAGEQMNHILNDLLDLSQLGSGNVELRRERLSVNTILKNCISIWQHRAAYKKLQLSVQLEDIPEIEYDRAKLTQVLETILAQAVDSSDAESELQITLRPTSDSLIFAISRPASGEEKSLKKEFAELLDGANAQGMKANSQALSLSIAAKLIRHFSGTSRVRLRNDGWQELEVELPLRLKAFEG